MKDCKNQKKASKNVIKIRELHCRHNTKRFYYGTKSENLKKTGKFLQILGHISLQNWSMPIKQQTNYKWKCLWDRCIH